MKQVSFGQIFSIYLGLFAFGTIVLPKLATLLVVLLLVLIIIGYVRKEMSWQLNRPGMFLMLLYLAYLIGIGFAHELSNGLKYAEYKLSLFIIPLLLSIKPKFELRFQWPVIGLLIGTLVVAGIGIMNSCNCYQQHPWLLYCFSSSYISPVHHPSYFSGFLLFATIGAWHGYRKRWKGFSLLTVIPYSLFALVFYFLCLSLAGMLFLGMLLVGLFVYLLYKKLGKWVALSALLIGPVLLYVVLDKLPGIQDDVWATKKGVIEYKSENKKTLL